MVSRVKITYRYYFGTDGLAAASQLNGVWQLIVDMKNNVVGLIG
jgi:hypothetical protein